MRSGVSDTELDQGTAETDEFPTVLEGGKRKADVLDAANVDVWMSTKVVRDHYVLNWNIGDIRNVASHDTIKSPLFRAGRHFQHIWEVEVTPTEIQGQQYLGVTVALVAFGNESALDAGRQLKVSLDVSIVNNEEQVCHGQHGTDYVDKGGSLGWLEFLKVNDLDSVVQENGDLRLLVSITIELDTHIQGQGQEVTKVTQGHPPPFKKTCIRQRLNRHEGHEVSDPGKVNDPRNTAPAAKEDSPHFRTPNLKSCIWKLGEQEPDFEIRSQSKTKLLVHKSMLAQKSGFLQKYFEQGGQDGIMSGHYCFNTEILKIILDFMYTGKIAEDVLEQHAKKIFEYCHHYVVPELQVLAEEALLKTVCAENADDFWFAMRHSDKLETRILEIFKQNPQKFNTLQQERFNEKLKRRGQEVVDLSVTSNDDDTPASYENDDGAVWKHGDEEPDFEITTWETNKKSFKVHKSVLASKNTFFKKHFENGPAHEQDSIHFEEGYPPAAVKIILDFIYTGKIDESAIRNNAADVFNFGDRWEVPELKNLAEEFLLDTVSAETVFDLWWAAECSNGAKLMAKITEFVQLHPDEFCPEDLEWLRRKLNLDADEFNDPATADWPRFHDWALGDEPPDYEIVTSKAKQKFLVHKSVLAQKSAFFKQNFENGVFSQQKRDVCHVSPETIRAALDFMYTGTIAEDFLESGHENVEELFELAEDWKWGIPELRILAEEAMVKYVCAETVFKWWFKCRPNAPKLKAKVCEYAQQHPEQFGIGCQKYFEDIRQQEKLAANSVSPKVELPGDRNGNQTA